MAETTYQPQTQQRILQVPAAEQKDALFRKHPFLKHFGTRQRNKAGEWLMVLAEREKLVSSFVQCIVDELARKDAREKMCSLVAGPSPEAMDKFIEAAKAKAEDYGIETDGLRHESVLEKIRRSPLDAVEITVLADVLRANGIFFGRYGHNIVDAFIADIIKYASFPFMTKPAAYVLCKDTMLFFGRVVEPGSPLFFFMPSAWADGHQFVIPHSRWYRSEALCPEAIQHEAQHMFDANAGIIFENIEYTPYLAGFAFAPEVRVYPQLPDPGPHSSARLRIHNELMALFDFGDAIRLISLSPEQVNAAALALLNAEYKRKIGFTYDELVAPFKELQPVI
ncbi:MAG: hypothetical protein AB1657_04520 [Candidatus Micrarchaeota archaeon]